MEKLLLDNKGEGGVWGMDNLLPLKEVQNAMNKIHNKDNVGTCI